MHGDRHAAAHADGATVQKAGRGLLLESTATDTGMDSMLAGFPPNGARTTGPAGCVSAAALCLLLAACCSENSPIVQRLRAQQAAVEQAGYASKTLAAEGMEFAVDAREGIELVPEVVETTCAGARKATVRISWNVALPGVVRVRAEVGEGGDAAVWADGGGQGAALTGPWVVDGTVFVFSDLGSGTRLGTIRAVGLPCSGAAR
ncbi:hypothetical protein [Pseudoxanthomonas broegbernensis]|uniref:hypothetical protein n=1 Tax=Pseudoxanthomonas broegbernensis TaxID=83619 RepID=UPI001390757F|nr:hypothetical protein [Pseudoxanthomonas broegbernensis]MBB6063636.1 hypothetical protein [Pseudoxanthomonas broegbernensis]